MGDALGHGAESVHVDPGHAGHALHRADDFAEQRRLPERALVETEAVQQRLAHRADHRLPQPSGQQLDLRAQHQGAALAHVHAQGQVSVAELAQRVEQVAVQIGRRVDRAVVGAGDGQVNQLAPAIGGAPRKRLGDAGETAREVGVVLHRHQPVQRHHRQRRVLTRKVAAFLVGPAGRTQRVDDFLDAQGPRLQHADLPRLDVAARADAAAVHGNNVLHATRQPRPVGTVAEGQGGGAGIVGERGEAALLRPEPRQGLALLPLDAVDTHLQRALRAFCGGCRDEGQRRLLERERLQALRAVAAAQHFLACAALGGLDDVAVDRQRVALVPVGEPGGQDQGGVNLVAGQVRVEAVAQARDHLQLADLHAADLVDVGPLAGKDHPAPRREFVVQPVELDLRGIDRRGDGRVDQGQRLALDVQLGLAQSGDLQIVALAIGARLAHIAPALIVRRFEHQSRGLPAEPVGGARRGRGFGDAQDGAVPIGLRQRVAAGHHGLVRLVEKGVVLRLVDLVEPFVPLVLRVQQPGRKVGVVFLRVGRQLGACGAEQRNARAQGIDRLKRRLRRVELGTGPGGVIAAFQVRHEVDQQLGADVGEGAGRVHRGRGLCGRPRAEHA